MKKVLFSLFSFFIFIVGVNAQTYTWTFDDLESDINTYINEDLFTLIEKADEWANVNNYFYFISWNTTRFVINVCDNGYGDASLINNSSNYLYVCASGGGYSIYRLSSDGSFSRTGSSSNPALRFTTYSVYIYSNFDLIPTFNHIINFSYKDLNYSITNGIKIPTLKDIYDDYNKLHGDVGGDKEDKDNDYHKEELNSLSMFYMLIFDRILLFSNYLLSNYIVLGSFVVILIFILILLLRRLL